MDKFDVDRYLEGRDMELWYGVIEGADNTMRLLVSEEPWTDEDDECYELFADMILSLKAKRPATVVVQFNDDYDYRDEVVKIVIRQVREYGKVYGFKVRVEE